MKTKTGSVQDKSVSTAVLAILAWYLVFAFSYVWFLPNYNLIKHGGRLAATTHATFKASVRPNNYNTPADKGVWLEKVSKTTPDNKRSAGLVLLGALVILSLVTVARSLNELLNPHYGPGGGHGIYAHQYAYLSLRTFRI